MRILGDSVYLLIPVSGGNSSGFQTSKSSSASLGEVKRWRCPPENPESVEGIQLSRWFEGCCALVLTDCKGCMPKTVAICGKAEVWMIVGQLSGSKPSPLLCQSNHQIIIFNFFMSPRVLIFDNILNRGPMVCAHKLLCHGVLCNRLHSAWRGHFAQQK